MSEGQGLFFLCVLYSGAMSVALWANSRIRAVDEKKPESRERRAA